LNDEHIFESAEPCSYTSNIGPLLKICKWYFDFFSKRTTDRDNCLPDRDWPSRFGTIEILFTWPSQN